MRHRSIVIAGVVCTGLTAGCVSNELIRSKYDACVPTVPERTATECGEYSVEQHSNYSVGFVEFDEQGWLYKREQMMHVLDHIRRQVESKQVREVTVVVFVHGWKHNASSDDRNVEEFRKVLQQIAQVRAVTDPKTAEERKIVGVYVGWRGLSLSWPEFLRNVTFWDRKAVASHVAAGSVREFFAQLRNLHLRQRAGGDERFKMAIIGHSFGGLIVYNAISQFLIESAVGNINGDGDDALVDGFADLVILVNPAFEASRYEPLFRVAATRSYAAQQRPVFVAVTAENDTATKYAFPIGRWFNSLFTSERTPEGKMANRNTIGHLARYRTHTLALCTKDRTEAEQRSRPLCTLDEVERGNLSSAQLKREQGVADSFYAEQTVARLDKAWRREFYGGTVLTRVPENREEGCDNPDLCIANPEPYTPFWVVGTTADVVDGHNGIFKEPFIDFFRQIFSDVYRPMPASAKHAKVRK